LDRKTVQDIVQAILIDRFNVKTEHFQWDKPLITLNEKFRILGVLVELEQLLQARLNLKLNLVEQIDTTIHSPMELVNFIVKELQ